MNVVRQIYASLESGVGHLDPAIVYFLLQMALLLIIPIAFCAVAFGRGLRSMPLQIGLAIMGVLSAMALPIERLNIENAAARLWLMAMALLCVSFLPPLLSYLTVPELGRQKIITFGIYVTMAVLAICQLCRAW